MSIAVRELVPVYLAMLACHKLFINSTIVFNVDNLSVVHMLNSQTSPDHVLMSMLRKIVVLAMLNNIVFIAKHIPGKLNVVADYLSRFQILKAKQVAPWLKDDPEFLHLDWYPW